MGIAQGGERVLLATLHFGAAESRIVVAGIVSQVRAGELLIIYSGRRWDHLTQTYRCNTGPYLIDASDAAMWGLRTAA